MALRPDEVRISPLGGLGEVGMNMMAYECGKTLMLVDAGCLFPEQSLLGIDLIIPDITHIRQNADKFAGIIVTHGHEDHMGAIPFILKEFHVPVWATRFTKALIESRLRERGIFDADLRTIYPGESFDVGQFCVTPISVNHSIPEAVSFAVKTPVGTIVHTGDFKIDLTPSDDSFFDFKTFANLGARGVRLLMMDSTNSMISGYSESEREVAASLDNIFNTTKGRILVTLFSSAIPRIISLLKIAQRYKRKVAVAGRSLESNIKTARQLGIIDAPDDLFIPIDEIKGYAPHRLLVIVTGSQGEARSALTRVAYEEHPHVKILPDDLIIFSSRQIPGNERAIFNIINHLMTLGANVHTQLGKRLIHASGHACRGELRTMIELTRPEFFIPVHGEPHHLATNKRLAEEMGVEPDNIMMIRNGDSIVLTHDGMYGEEPVTVGRVYVDGRGVGDVEEPVIRDRLKLAQTGLVICAVVVEARSWKILSGPDFIQRGFTGETNMEELEQDAKTLVTQTIETLRKKPQADVPALEEELRVALRRFFNQKFDRKPVVIPIVIEA